MTGNTLQQRIRDLNENARFQLLGRVVAVIGTPIVLGLTGWALSILLGISNDVAVLKTKVESATTDVYKGADAKRDFELRDNMIKNDGARIDDIAERVKTLESASSRRQ